MSNVPVIVRKWLARLQEKLPDRQIGLVPADAFFKRKVELPEDLSRDDRLAFIELALEGNAPFPMEQLAWGFLESDASPFVYVYATPKSRLKQLELADLNTFYQLFPGFITLFGEVVDKPTVRFLAQNGVLSALFLSPQNPVPENIVSRAVKADLLTDDQILAVRDKLAHSLSTEGYEIETGVWNGEGMAIRSDGQPRFAHRHLDTGTPLGLREHTLSLPEHSLWAADLRDSAYADSERNTRKRSRLIWTSLRVAIVTTVALLLLQICVLGLSAYNAFLDRRILELEPQATRVENKLTLADRLTQSTEEDIKPFLLMEAINPLRPDSIYFDKVRSRAFNQLEIEGESSEGVTPVNAFADSIQQLGLVASVENNSRTRNNQTSFEFLITFDTLPPEPEGGFIIPEEEEDSEEEDGESEEQTG